CWFGRGVKCEEVGEWRKIYTIIGVCYSFRRRESAEVHVVLGGSGGSAGSRQRGGLGSRGEMWARVDFCRRSCVTDSEVTTSGLFNNFYLKVADTDEIHFDPDEVGWKIHLQDPTDSDLIDIRTNGFTLFPGWSKDVRIDLRDFKTLDTKKRPCDENEEYSESKCKAECFVREVFERANCSLPYMTKVIPAPTCDTKESYASATKAANRLLFWGEWNPQVCVCARQCDHRYYVPFGESVQTGGNRSRLRIYYEDLTFEDVVEEYSYTIIPLLCDIGGTLGLLLGASWLTFIEFFEILGGYMTTVRRIRVNSPPTFK
ncbi:unnamed protein product, partial [Darwinula stevensoni]